MAARHASKSLLDAIPSSRSGVYVCRRCQQSVHQSNVLVQQRRYASDQPEKLPFAERVRRKLWKGKPPGPDNVEDVYGGPGAFETMRMERQRRKALEKAERDLDSQLEAGNASPTQNAQVSQTTGQGESQPATTTYSPVSSNETDTEFARNESQNLAQDKHQRARTWDGLELIGSQGDWREMPKRPQDEYQPWLKMSKTPTWTYDNLVSFMHQALVECYAYTNAGYNPKKAAAIRPVALDKFISYSEIGIIVSSTGAIESADLKSVPKDFVGQTGQGTLHTVESRETYHPQDLSFLDAHLDVSQPITFAVLKRFSALCSYRISDPLISTLVGTHQSRATIQDFLTTLAEEMKPKPANLAEQLLSNESLLAQNNVLILGRRETPIDKEKEVGRWKIIEAELRARGLPVLGKAEIQR